MDMKQEQEMEDRLWDYIDGAGDAAARSEIAGLLTTRDDWREKHHELMELHRLINQTELEVPSMRFTKNVMEEIAKFQVAPATKNYINKNVIRGIGGVFAGMILTVLVYVLTQLHWTGSNQQGPSSSPIFGNFSFGNVNAGNLNWSKLFNNTYVDVFLMINTVLGLMLLDMYLERKKHAHPDHTLPGKGKNN